MGTAWRIGKSVFVEAGALMVGGLLALGCGESPEIAQGADAVEVGAQLGGDGCSTHLAPAIGAMAPSPLGAAGPWQLCGAYGTGGAHLVKTSADGGRIALLTDSGQAWVLDTNGFHARGPFAHGDGAISFVGLSPDGQLLATVDDPGQRVALWNVNQKRLLRVMERPPLSGPSYFGLGDVAFSRDGRLLAVVSGSHIDVFTTATGASSVATTAAVAASKKVIGRKPTSAAPAAIVSPSPETAKAASTLPWVPISVVWLSPVRASTMSTKPNPANGPLPK